MMNILMMIDIRIIRRMRCKLRERTDQTVDACPLCRRVYVIMRIKVFRLRISVCITKNISNARFDATLNHQQIPKEQSAQ